MSTKEQFVFENYALDIARRELCHDGAQVALEPQVFDLLVYVIRNRDRVVSKDDLIEAVWGGRIVSESSLTTRINAARKAIGDSGEAQRLIRTVARKGIRFVGAVKEGEAAPAIDPVVAERSPLPLPDKPSIAVLPFQNMSDDPSQDYFCDGMVEEIITALSRFQRLFVIARNSTFSYKNRAVDVKQVGRELGVRYVLGGSVRKAGSKVRITGQLIDAMSGAHLWADRFDSEIADLFELQDRITASVVGTIAPRIEAAEIERARRKPATNLDAYDLCLRARSLVYGMTREGTSEAIDLLDRAARLDPTYALAMARAAGCYSWRANNGWADDAETEGERAIQLARAAIALDKDDPEVLAPAAFTLNRFTRDLVEALFLIDRALSLNANFAEAWAFSGYFRLFAGRHEEAIEHFERSLRISPQDSFRHLFLGGLGMAFYASGKLERAVEVLDHATREHRNNPSNFRFLASALAQLGRITDAAKAARIALEIDPRSTLAVLKRRNRHYPKFNELYLDGLRKVGYPE